MVPGKASISSSGSVFHLAWALYLDKLAKKPVQTKAFTAAFIQAASDVVAQSIVGRRSRAGDGEDEKKKRKGKGGKALIDVRRTALMAVFGFVWVGPGLHYWQRFLESKFAGRKQSLRLVLEKACFDQAFYGPVANVAMMTFITLLIEKKSAQALRKKLTSQLVGVQLNAWKVWPLASILNYSFVPVELRVLFMNLVGFGWSTFLNYSSSRTLKLKKIIN